MGNAMRLDSVVALVVEQGAHVRGACWVLQDATHLVINQCPTATRELHVAGAGARLIMGTYLWNDEYKTYAIHNLHRTG